MHMDRNVNIAKPVNLYIKESAKYIQNMGNVDFDKDVIIVMISKEHVRGKKNMDGVSLQKNVLWTLRQNET